MVERLDAGLIKYLGSSYPEKTFQKALLHLFSFEWDVSFIFDDWSKSPSKQLAKKFNEDPLVYFDIQDRRIEETRQINRLVVPDANLSYPKRLFPIIERAVKAVYGEEQVHVTLAGGPLYQPEVDPVMDHTEDFMNMLSNLRAVDAREVFLPMRNLVLSSQIMRLALLNQSPAYFLWSNDACFGNTSKTFIIAKSYGAENNQITQKVYFVETGVTCTNPFVLTVITF